VLDGRPQVVNIQESDMRNILLLLICSFSSVRAELNEENVVYAATNFRVVRIAPERVQLVWKDAAGEPFRSFDLVQESFSARGKSVKFLMNAGIFEPGGIPSGLHVEGGKTLHPLNLADAPGNFFLKPNGVCTYSKGRPFIGTCPAWQKQSTGDEIWGIQSGPMLLIDGKRHPAFTENSKSKLHRNGVGIDGQGRFVFAITGKGGMVNFWDFAGLFLKLGCKNALFLDGDISQMSVNPSGPVKSNRFGAMFVITE
jgi:uncharacterized protein YigE (DUF2233 family)